jgi:FMN-dependent NADH-azoreductase
VVELTAVYIEAWRTANPGGTVLVRDLAKTNLPFVDLAWIEGAFTPAETHSPESAAAWLGYGITISRRPPAPCR